MNKTIYYASVIGKLPRKRKEDRFEIQMEGDTPIEAITKLRELVIKNGIRGARTASFQAWECSEIDFIDFNGKKQTLVMRSIFPSGNAIALEL